MKFQTKHEADIYFKGLKDGIELGATMDPSEYSMFVHHRMLDLLKRVDRDRLKAMEGLCE